MSRYELTDVVFSAEDIQKRVKELGAELTELYKNERVIAICVLKGAVLFMTDLIREMNCDVQIDFMAVSSYGSSTKSSGVVRIMKDLDRSIQGENVLIVEDIIDSGLTLSYLKENLKGRGAKDIKIVTLFDKPARRKVDLKPDYIGFAIPDSFIVGYGLDVDEEFRNLPYIANFVDHGEEQ